MQIIVDNILRIINPTDEIIKYCKKNLQIDNPQFLQNQRLGFPVYNIPTVLRWYEKRGNDYILPFGCLNDIYKLHPVKKDYILKIQGTEKVSDYKSNISLFDYQETAKNAAIKAKNGVIVMPAGSGKTQTALQLIKELGLKTLWLTHTLDLQSQSYDRAKNNFEGIQISKIGNGKIDIAEHITFATVQTMAKMDLSQYKNEWDCIVVDEAHRVCRNSSSIRIIL